MQFSSTLLTAFTVLSTVFSPTFSNPVPALAKPIIERQGRELSSRFSPAVRPVYNHPGYHNHTHHKSPDDPTEVDKRDPAPAPVIDYADHVGPTATGGHGHGKHHHHDHDDRD